MAVPVDLLNNSDSSSDEDLSDSETYSSEDESMEEDASSNSEITTAKETETKRSDEEDEEEAEEFWIRYPYLKNFLSTSVAQGLIPEYYVIERAKLIGDEKAKELNERGKALFLRDLEACKDKCELIASAIIAMKSVK
ncbi:hypothetical protein N665_1153s0011 [Sinapis alba]|nr:hypothetical protein N665_1153s0011 [Sinapis alba]